MNRQNSSGHGHGNPITTLPYTTSQQAMVTLRSGVQATDAEEIEALVHSTDALVPCLQVKPSSIQGGGDGLFATVNLPALKPLVLYYGELRQGKAQGRYCVQVGPCLTLDAEALLSFAGSSESDAHTASAAGRGDKAETQNLGRYVNDARGQASLENNMRYGRLLRFDETDEDEESGAEGVDATKGSRRKRKEGGRRPPCVVMYSTRKIKAGEELFASYGKWYWQRWGDLLKPSVEEIESRKE